MKMKCLACGVQKDTSVKEFYPFPDDAIVTDVPIGPLFAIDCCGNDWRIAIVCHGCMHRLDPDLWISEAMWAALAPVTPFEALPLPRAEKTTRSEVEPYS